MRLTLTVERTVAGSIAGPTTDILIPVATGTREYVNAEGRTAAERIRSLAPLGAAVAAASRPAVGAGPTLVALAGSDGNTVGYYASMDAAVRGLSVSKVADALAASIAE